MENRIITKANIHQLHQVHNFKGCFSEAETTAVANYRASGATVKFSHDNKTIASLGFDTSIHIFDINRRRKIYSQYATYPVHVGDNYAISFHPTEKVIVTNHEENIHFINYTKEEAQPYAKATTGLEDWSEAFSFDGKLVAHQNYDLSTSVLEYPSMTQRFVFSGHTSRICGMVFSPNDEFLATAGNYISSGRIDETVRIWNLSEGYQQCILRLNNDYMPMVIAFSPDSKTIAVSYFVGSVGEIYLFDVQTGHKLQVFKGHTRPANCLVFSRDGKRLVSASWDGSIRTWDTTQGRSIRHWNHENGHVLFTRLLFNLDETLLITSVREGEMVFLNSELDKIEARIPLPELLNFDLSPDGQFLATGHWDGIRLWEV